MLKWILTCLIILALVSGAAPETATARPDIAGRWNKAGNIETEKNPGAYIVYVVDQDGRPVEGAAVNFCTDTACIPRESDAEGRIVFTGEPLVYHVQIADVPDGYSDEGAGEITTTAEYGEWVITIRKE